MSSLKLGVEVVSAHDLAIKDVQGRSGAYVELQFDDQVFRTTLKEKDNSPVWNESFYFNITDPRKLADLTLDAYVYYHNIDSDKKKALGKISLNGTSFVSYSDAIVFHYPLEKSNVFSRVKGELGLKVFLTDDPSVRTSVPLPPMGTTLGSDPRSVRVQSAQQVPSMTPDAFSNDDTAQLRRKRVFRDLPKSGGGKEQQQHQTPEAYPLPQGNPKYTAHEMKPNPPPSRMFNMYPGPQQADFTVRETNPTLGGGRVVGGRVIPNDRPATMHDLVEPMRFLFVRVVKARDLPAKDVTGSLDPYVEVKIGNYKGQTKHFEKRQNPEWNEVFAFASENIQAHVLEVTVMDKDFVLDDYVGSVHLPLIDVPTRVPPDSPLAPEWYRLEDKNGERKKGELMLAVWFGTQADEAFPEACHSDTSVPDDRTSISQAQIRSKVYHSPRLWYVRVHVIDAQDLIAEKNRFPDAYVRVQIGNQLFKTKTVQARNMNPMWNEEIMLVAAEPFEDHLILSVEDRVAPNKEEILGQAVIPLSQVDKRLDDIPIRPRWYNLEKSKSAAMDPEHLKKDRFFSKLQLRICLEGGYHVLDGATQYSSDLRPTAKQLWKSSIGVLELGILGADGLHPMKTRDGRGTSDTYCVAKYGLKWVRTRTILNSLSPKYNEQYTWEVFDPATVLILGVFDNSQVGGANGNRDMRIGKVRIRISTLEAGRVYTHSYPLLLLQHSGVKKMGEVHLAIRFSYSSMMNMMHIYFKPLLPKMHYKKPLTIAQQDVLRHQAVSIVASRLGRAEPPLRKEVVEYISDTDSHLFSMRRSKANFFRLMTVFSGLIAVYKWFGDVCKWKNSVTTVLVHVLFLMLVFFPELILPTAFLYMFVIGAWNYRYRPRHPPHMNPKISFADAVSQDELDEELDTFPTSRSHELVRYRYDRLRHVAGRIQTVVGDLACQGERLLALLSWRDTRATLIFMIFCLVAAVVLYVTPFNVLAALSGFYVMRHPRFRHKVPSAPANFFRRLPAMADSML